MARYANSARWRNKATNWLKSIITNKNTRVEGWRTSHLTDLPYTTGKTAHTPAETNFSDSVRSRTKNRGHIHNENGRCGNISTRHFVNRRIARSCALHPRCPENRLEKIERGDVLSCVLFDIWNIRGSHEWTLILNRFSRYNRVNPTATFVMWIGTML